METITLKISFFGRLACKSSLLANFWETYGNDKHKAINFESKERWPVYWYRQIRLGRSPRRNTGGLSTQISNPSYFFLQRWRSKQTGQTWALSPLSAFEGARRALKCSTSAQGLLSGGVGRHGLQSSLSPPMAKGSITGFYRLWHPCQTTHLFFLPTRLLTEYSLCLSEGTVPLNYPGEANSRYLAPDGWPRHTYTYLFISSPRRLPAAPTLKILQEVSHLSGWIF